jgi:hypothetical protein
MKIRGSTPVISSSLLALFGGKLLLVPGVIDTSHYA